jgi:hypothetical protein
MFSSAITCSSRALKTLQMKLLSSPLEILMCGSGWFVAALERKADRRKVRAEMGRQLFAGVALKGGVMLRSWPCSSSTHRVNALGWMISTWVQHPAPDRCPNKTRSSVKAL